MYRVYAADKLIYDSRIEDYPLIKAQVTLEVNKSGSFVFAIPETHPYYDFIEKMKTIVKVYRKDRVIFRGRVLTDQLGFRKDKTFTCEGEMSFLLDTIQRPYNFTGTPKELFEQFISTHNAQVEEEKQFEIGEVTVTDPNDYMNRNNESYEDTLSNIQSRLIDSLGGYIYITRNQDTGKPIINYLEDFPYITNQKIVFAENMLDLVRTDNAESVATAIIPLGAKIELEDGSQSDQRLTIADVNEGVDYIYDQDAVDKYGWIFKVVTWDDVTIASNLKTKAIAELVRLIEQSVTYDISAVDLSLLDKSMDSFNYGTYVKIISKPHGIDENILLKKQTFNILKPQTDKISLGYTYATFTDKTVSSNNSSVGLIQRVEVIEGNYATNTIVSSEIKRLQSLINQTSESISFEVSSNYVSNDKLTAELGTLFTQLNDSFEFMFKSLQTTVDENNADTMTKFEEMRKYIRFEDGNIILGESNNELTLKIENDILAFYDNGAQIAYFQNRKLYVYDGEFLNSLKIGKFAFVPRTNGNLSFKKVED